MAFIQRCPNGYGGGPSVVMRLRWDSDQGGRFGANEYKARFLVLAAPGYYALGSTLSPTLPARPFPCVRSGPSYEKVTLLRDSAQTNESHCTESLFTSKTR